jgi:peptidyl-prolyl cis-trans isomerase SurA
MSEGLAEIKDSIFATVGDKAITRSDIISEIKVILVISGSTYSEKIKKQLDNSAIKTILKRTIKNIEIEKYDSLKFDPKDIQKELNRFANNLNIDVETFLERFQSNGISKEKIEDQIKTELLWNSLIFKMYKDRLNINLQDIDDQLKKIKKERIISEYLLSEIIIKPIAKESLEEELEKLYNEIEIKGFDQVAIEKSLSESAIKGGNLGWINENSISDIFKNEIINITVGNISNPIFLPQGILFLKLNDKKTLKKVVDLEIAKNQLVNAEKMKILNMYSLSHYDKLKRTVSIVYY